MMAISNRGGGAVAALLRGSTTTCSHCARRAQPAYAVPRRLYSDAAVAAATPASTTSSEPLVPPPVPPVASISQTDALPSERGLYAIKAGLILTRPPLLTRLPTPFESSFYLYQKRLNERLAAPFRKHFYFKQDTPRQMDWRIKVKEQHGVAGRDIGRYNPRSRMGWNDEVLTGSLTSDPAQVTEKLVAGAEMRISEDGEAISADEVVRLERPLPRRTEADENNDVRRLDRALDQTLYLVVKRGEGETAAWGFPSGDVPTHETLHETAGRILAESAGVNMNTWLVARHPVAVHKMEPILGQDSSLKSKGEKLFLLKGRIMAGQADLTGNKHNLTDFKWLTKEELMKTLPADYAHNVRGMVAER